MKKSVLLGVVAVVVLALPAFAGDYKGDPWRKNVVVTWQEIKLDSFPVKMRVPWYIKIVNQEDWEIILEQIDCARLERGQEAWPCFKGCKDLVIACNFDCTLRCGVYKSYIPGNWGCWLTKPDILKPGDTTTVCVALWATDLLSMGPVGQTVHVADVSILVKPTGSP